MQGLAVLTGLTLLTTLLAAVVLLWLCWCRAAASVDPQPCPADQLVC
jgi:hypothetical protein